LIEAAFGNRITVECLGPPHATVGIRTPDGDEVTG
jgi:hypothetical protein